MIFLRIAFSFGSLLSINEIIECSRILSKYNPDSIWIPETWGMECFSMISTISQIAKKPKLGTSIVNIYSRSPTLIAMAAVTMDTISQGRFILGLGTSSQSIIGDWHGMKFVEPLERMHEYVKIIRLIIQGGKANYNGNLFQLKNFSLLIESPRKQIPIYLAAVNQKMIELTWKIADGVIFYLRPINELQKTVEKMQQVRKIDVACQLITSVSDDEEKAMNRAKKTIAFYVSVGKIYREFLARNGFQKETTAIYEAYKKSGLVENYKMVPDFMVHDLTICGTTNEIKKQLSKFIRAGINLPILQFNPIGDVKKSFNLLISAIAGDMN